MKWLLFSLTVGSSLFACDDHIYSGGSGHSSGESSGDALGLLTESCAGCHGGGLAPGLAENICDNVVNVPSTQVPSMNYVTPNDLENSYLWHKINDTADAAGGSGSVMPSTGALAATDITIIEEWIMSGASCDTTVDPDTEDTAEPAVEPSTEDTGATTGVDLANGEAIVTGTCNGCHTGYAPDFATMIPTKSDGQIIDAIVIGFGGMPAQPSVSDYELIDVVAYLRETYGE
jgi:cytochrome c5